MLNVNSSAPAESTTLHEASSHRSIRDFSSHDRAFPMALISFDSLELALKPE
jgi:hypothetical protein